MALRSVAISTRYLASKRLKRFELRRNVSSRLLEAHWLVLGSDLTDPAHLRDLRQCSHVAKRPPGIRPHGILGAREAVVSGPDIEGVLGTSKPMKTNENRARRGPRGPCLGVSPFVHLCQAIGATASVTKME